MDIERNFENVATRVVVAIAVISAIGWIAAVTFYWSRFGDRALSTDPSQWGPFGDYIGGLLNPLLGTLTLVARVVTVRLQVTLLRDSRLQVTTAQSALEQTKNVHYVEMHAARQQAFEETFFGMLDSVNQRASDMEFEGVRGTPGMVTKLELRGLPAAAQHIARFHWYVHERAKGGDPKRRALQRYELLNENANCNHASAEIIDAWKEYVLEHDSLLAPFLRSLVNVCNYALTSAPEGVDAIRLNQRLRDLVGNAGLAEPTFIHQRQFYANIVTDHRGRLELKLLAFHAASSDVNDKARIVVKSFDACRTLRGQAWWANPILASLVE